MVNKLWVVMPVYNEQDCIQQVVYEWLGALRRHFGSFVFCILNDGSKDNTREIIEKIVPGNPEIKLINKVNTGHGQTCVSGYKTALENGAEWILQVDSDGQCSPDYLPVFLKSAETNTCIYGYRKTRDDGLKRWLVSRIVSWFTLGATGVWVRDANVPYRLMHRKSLDTILPQIPADFYLANILVAVLQQKEYGIKWVDIHFRQRAGGVASVKAFKFAKEGFKLFKQLKKYVN